MTCVLDLSHAELRQLAARHSPQEVARVRMLVAQEKYEAALAHWKMLLGVSVAAALTARAALGTPEFASRFLWARRQSAVAASAQRRVATARNVARLRRAEHAAIVYAPEQP